MIINDKKELLEKLQKAKENKIYIDACLISINHVIIPDNEVHIIYSDDDVINFCDMNGMNVFYVFIEDLENFEILCEYDENGYIK